MKYNFAYFIASYGKPDNIMTLRQLQELKVKYPIYIVVGKDDPKLAEYKTTYKDNLLVFDKLSYIDKIDDVGMYAETHKVCTYSRLAVQDFAKRLSVKYVCYMFDDIKYFQLRYISKDHTVKSIRKFDFDKMMDMYIDLLKSSKDLIIVGPPNSSFYIGVNSTHADKYSTRYGNMFVYDTNNMPDVMRSSVLEDMDIILTNNKLGKMSICPFGLQVCCRDSHATDDSYNGMTKLEFLQHHVLLCQKPFSIDKPMIPYANFTPKIISEKHRKTSTTHKHGRLI